MARLGRRVGIAQIKTNLPQRASVGNAVVNLAGTVQQIAADRLTDQRTQEANIAAQEMTFERDANGVLQAPQLHRDENGLIAPNIYSRQYAEVVSKRYMNQMQLDVNKNLNGIAAQHRNDPEGFEASSGKYLETTIQNALPEVQAEIELMGQEMQVGHFNRLVRERSEWEFKKTVDTWNSKMALQMDEMTGAAQSGLDPAVVTTMAVGLLAEYDQGTLDGVNNGSGREQLQIDMAQNVARGILAHGSTMVPGNDVDELAFLKQTQQLLEGDAEIMTIRDGEYVSVPVEEIFPTREERGVMVEGVGRFIAARLQLRNSIDAAHDQVQLDAFIATHTPNWIAAMENGTRFDTDVMFEEMLTSAGNNPGLFARADAMRRVGDAHNLDILEGRQGAANLESSMKLLEVKYGALTQEQMDAVNSLARAMDLGDFMTALEGNVDPDPLSRLQVYNQLKSILATVDTSSGAKPPKALTEYLAELQRAGIRNDTNRATIIANAPDRADGSRPESFEDLTPEELVTAQANLARTLPGLNLTQNKESAEWWDEQYYMRWGEADPAIRQSWGDLSSDDMKFRLDDIGQMGVIPISLTKWLQGSLQNVALGGIEQDEFTRLMDYSTLIYDNPRLSANADTAFSDEMSSAMWGIARMAGPLMTQHDNEAARDLVSKAMRGESIVRDFYDLKEIKQEEITDAMRLEFVDNYQEWFPWWGIGDKGERQILTGFAPGPIIDFAPGFEERFQQLALGHANVYGLENPEGRKQAYRAAERSMKLEGWALDQDAITNHDASTPWYFGFTVGISDNKFTDRPGSVWRNDSIRGIIDDEEVIQGAYTIAEKYAKGSKSFAALNEGGKPVTPKVGVNMKLVNVGIQTRSDGVQEYGFEVRFVDTDGNMRTLQDDENLNANMIFFFSLTQEQIEARRARVIEELKTANQKSADFRNMRRKAKELQMEMIRKGHSMGRTTQ